MSKHLRGPIVALLIAFVPASIVSGCGSQPPKDFKGSMEDSAKAAVEGKAKLKVDRTKGPRGKGMADDDTF
jgi:hypothetical protein